MSVVIYRCPVSANEVKTRIETSKDTLVKMGGMGLSIWMWCPHCVDGHQINAADAVVEDKIETVGTAPLS